MQPLGTSPEDFYRAIADSAADWETWVGADGQWLYCSASCERMTGYAPQAFLGQPQLFLDIIHPEDMPTAAAHFQREMASPETEFSITFRIRARDGTVRWIEHVCHPMTGEGARIGGRRASNRDVTARKEAEASLRERNICLAITQEVAHVGDWSWDIARDQVTWSDEMFRIFGVDRAGFRGDMAALKMLIHPDDLPRHEKHVANLLAGVQEGPFEYRILRPDGTQRIVRTLKGQLESDAEGRPVRLFGVVADVTESRQNEQALRQSKRELQDLIANLPGAVFRCRNDANWTFDFVSLPVLSLSGHPPQDFLAGRVHWGQLIHPEDQLPVQNAVQDGLAIHQPWRIQYRIRTASNEERWVWEQGNGVWDAAGGLMHLEGFIMDITEYRRAQEALLESHRLIEAILNATPMLVACMDRNFNFLAVNNAYARADGKEPAFFPGKNHFELYPNAENEAIFRNVVETGNTYSIHAKPFEYAEHPERGTSYWDWSLVPIKASDGEVRTLVMTLANVTEQVRTQEALQQLNEHLEQRVDERTAEVQRLADQLRALATELSRAEQRERNRLAMILHDHIQQLLVGAQMQLSLIKRGDPDIIKSAAQGINSILGEAINASRSLTVELCPPVLHQAGLAAALSWLAPRMQEKHQFKVHVRANNDAEPATPELRAFLFESVREMLLNAMKHSGINEATVTMLRTPENQCRIIVEDHGNGFDPAGIRPGPSGGFGIFSIQQRLLYMGGTMEIESSPGHGARMTLTVPMGLPSIPAAPAMPPGEALEISFKAKGKNIRVLLVDDHKIMRQGLSSLLQLERDIDIIGEAENGRQALDVVRQLRPDVVIMDVNMPVMNGIEATRVISSELPEIRVIGLSMHIDKNAADAMRAAGAVAYLTKGGPSEDLIAAIRACAGR